MKTRHILVYLLLLAAGCAKEPQQENSNDNVAGHIPMVFRAETQEISKVLLSDNRVTLNWQVDDKIKIFDGTSDNLAPFVSADSGPAVDFYGKVSNEEGPFYALYPYQEGATFAGGTIYANVPQVQIASAGNVPQNAFIAAAKSDTDGLLKFTTVLSYIRFKLVDTDAGNIESMTLSGNSGEQLAGSVKITFDQYGIPSDVIDSNGQAYSSVILSGSFENGKDYFFAVREQASFSDGVTISILYKNGNRRYISSDSNFVNESDAPITITPNMVLNIDRLSATQMNADTPSDRYIAYLHGWDLTIAGETYNIAVHGEPSLVKATASERSVDIKSALNKEGMIFLDSSEGDECTLNSIPNIKGSLVALIGRYENQNNIFTPRCIIKLMDGKFVMKDLRVDLQNIKYSGGDRYAYFITFHGDATSDVEAFHMDKCKISNVWYDFLRQDNSSYALKQVRIVNSDIEVDKTFTNDVVVRVLDFAKCQCLNRIEEITFNNNIVFHRYPETGTIELTCRVIDVEETKTAIPRYSEVNTWNTKISFCNNTMYNVPTPHGFVKFYRVKNLAVQKNICATSDTYDAYSGYLLWLYDWKQSDVVDLVDKDNKFYGLAEGNAKNWNITNSSSAWRPDEDANPTFNMNPVRETEFPFTANNFTFIQKAKYAAYGAQR